MLNQYYQKIVSMILVAFHMHNSSHLLCFTPFHEDGIWWIFFIIDWLSVQRMLGVARQVTRDFDNQIIRTKSQLAGAPFSNID